MDEMHKSENIYEKKNWNKNVNSTMQMWKQQRVTEKINKHAHESKLAVGSCDFRIEQSKQTTEGKWQVGEWVSLSYDVYIWLLEHWHWTLSTHYSNEKDELQKNKQRRQ